MYLILPKTCKAFSQAKGKNAVQARGVRGGMCIRIQTVLERSRVLSLTHPRERVSWETASLHVRRPRLESFLFHLWYVQNSHVLKLHRWKRSTAKTECGTHMQWYYLVLERKAIRSLLQLLSSTVASQPQIIHKWVTVTNVPVKLYSWTPKLTFQIVFTGYEIHFSNAFFNHF